MKQFICFFSGLLLLFVSTTRVVAQEVSDYSQLSEEDYNNLVETMYLNSIPGMSEKLKDGIETPLEECEEFEW